MTSTPGFRITGKKGFHITFENGYTVSVQFGPGNYCDHYGRHIGHEEERCGKEGSTTAEVAAWGPNSEMLPIGRGDTVTNRSTPAEVLRILNDIAGRSAEPVLEEGSDA